MAKKIGILVLCVIVVVVIALIAFADQPEVKTGQARGYGGMVTATVTLEGGKITKVELDAPGETAGVGTKAIEQLPDMIVKKGDADVDIVAGATITSKAIIEAVNQALGKETDAPTAEGGAQPEKAELYLGLGVASSGRVGPGKDEKGTAVYSINQPFAAVVFDQEDRVKYIHVDQVEVATPNYDGADMPHFTGFPGQAYNEDAAHDGKISGQITVNEESFLTELEGFKTKRERGDSYKLGKGTWAAEMDAFESVFVGKTIGEIENWVKTYCSDKTGRPLQPDMNDPDDQKKYNALPDEEKKALFDVTSAATMSLTDAHGDLIAAIKKAFDNKQPVTGKPAAIGTALKTAGRVTGKDSIGNDVFSFNEIFAVVLFDESDKIVGSSFDQLEVSAGNAPGDAPRFSGYPGQQALGDTNEEITDESFMSQIAALKTKRERGESYRMPAGSWASQMDAYQALFTGKSVTEVEQWFEKFCTDEGGKPLKNDMTEDQDRLKYEALSEEEKQELTDVVSKASMSLSNQQGDFLGALKAAFDNKKPLESEQPLGSGQPVENNQTLQSGAPVNPTGTPAA